MEECELCGTKINDVYVINLDGTQLSVCAKCAKGKAIIRSSNSEIKKMTVRRSPAKEEAPLKENMVRLATVTLKASPLYATYLRSLKSKYEHQLVQAGAKIANDQITLSYKGHDLSFRYVHSDPEADKREVAGLLIEQFINEQYARMLVSKTPVLDIGASIGDSAIYFAVKGAEHVYAYEPYPYPYRIAQINVMANKLDKQITLINEAVCAKKTTMRLNQNMLVSGNPLRDTPWGENIATTTLSEIVKRFKLEKAALKIDCEGDEYAIIRNADNSTLQHFKQIIIETHYGYSPLVAKLKHAGFGIELSPERYANNTYAKNPDMKVGLLYAYARSGVYDRQQHCTYYEAHCACGYEYV